MPPPTQPSPQPQSLFQPNPAPATTATTTASSSTTIASTTTSTPTAIATAHLELGVALTLYTWPTLSLAVANSWGGPDSAAKRDWLCGAVPDILLARPDTDVADVEEVLLQVMADEFDVVVEDGSAAETAARVVAVRDQVLRQGDVGGVRAMWATWKEREARKGGRKVGDLFKKIEGDDDDDSDDDGDDNDDDDDDGDDDDETGDVDMTDAPPRTPRSRPVPEVDEDGFTTVVRKK